MFPRIIECQIQYSLSFYVQNRIAKPRNGMHSNSGPNPISSTFGLDWILRMGWDDTKHSTLNLLCSKLLFLDKRYDILTRVRVPAKNDNLFFVLVETRLLVILRWIFNNKEDIEKIGQWIIVFTIWTVNYSRQKLNNPHVVFACNPSIQNHYYRPRWLDSTSIWRL